MSDTTQTPMQAPDPQGTGRPRTGRLVKVLLTLSLTLNLLVLGLVVGAQMRDRRDDRRFPPPDWSVARDMGLGPFIGAFPRDQRRDLALALRERAGPFQESRLALVDEMQVILDVLRTEPFDAAEFDDLLQSQGERIRIQADIGRKVLVDQITAMSATDRARFADSLERGLRKSMDRVREDWRDRRGGDRDRP